MSTAAGYAVLKGISFEQLVWFCARAFIERDDQSLDVYEGYRIKALEETLAENRAELDRVLSWTDAEYHEYRDEQRGPCSTSATCSPSTALREASGNVCWCSSGSTVIRLLLAGATPPRRGRLRNSSTA